MKKNEIISIRIDKGLKKSLKVLAAENDTSIAQEVRRIVRLYLGNPLKTKT